MEEIKVTTVVETEINVHEDVVNKLSEEDKKQLIFDVFDVLPACDKAEITSDCFASMDDETQKKALDEIIANQLSDEQFHVLTEYFKKYGK